MGSHEPQAESGLRLANTLYRPEHELGSVTDQLDGGMRLGEQGGREWFEEMDKAFESWETRIEEVTAIDDDRVRSYTWARFKANRVERPPSSVAEP